MCIARLLPKSIWEDELQNNEFNGKASYKDKAGLLYFGGMNG